MIWSHGHFLYISLQLPRHAMAPMPTPELHDVLPFGTVDHALGGIRIVEVCHLAERSLHGRDVGARRTRHRKCSGIACDEANTRR